MLKSAVLAFRAALDLERVHRDAKTLKIAQHGLGNALSSLGEITKDTALLTEAVDHLSQSLALKNKSVDPHDWWYTPNSIALARRRLGTITKDLDILTQARVDYAACEELQTRGEAAFLWAVTQWNIADLALARFALEPDPTLLTEARRRVNGAREVFVDGSDYQTQRCDDLLAQIDAAEAV